MTKPKPGEVELSEGVETVFDVIPDLTREMLEGLLKKSLLETERLTAQVKAARGEAEQMRAVGRRQGLEEAIAACQRVAVKLDAHYEEFGFGVSNGHIEASGALMCRAALEDLAEPHPESSDA